MNDADPEPEVGRIIGEDPRLFILMRLVRKHCGGGGGGVTEAAAAASVDGFFRGREIANVIRGLAVLRVDVGVNAEAMDDEELDGWVVEMVKRKAPEMNSQEIAMTLNALSKLESAALAMVRESKGGREGGSSGDWNCAAKEGEVLEMKGGERKKGGQAGKRADYYLFFLTHI